MSAIAIIGMACLFPGATTPDDFWSDLVQGVDRRREGGVTDFGIDPASAGIGADGRPRIWCTRGGFITDFTFDPNGYLLPAAYLTSLDRVFQWPLQVAREALADAGFRDRPAQPRTGLVIGNYTFPTVRSGELVLPVLQSAVFDGLRAAGVGLIDPEPTTVPTPENLWAGGLPARVVGAALGLEGPQFALDAACSSALYGIKLACDHLADHSTDLMLAGGVCAPDPALIHLSFSDLQAYPRNGVSQPFDSRSSGIITGQGAGIVVLKRLDDALRDGDRIHAVLETVALSNDGSGRHLLSPNPDGQLRTYQLAYAASGIDPATVDYVECHATGTPLGDRTEAETLGRFFGDTGRQPLVGSVKGNVGHLLTVAGLTSLIKVILAMQHGRIPATLGVAEPLTSRDGALGADQIVRAERPWPDRGPIRRAGVSAFGFGGTNAHAVLTQPPSPGTAPAADDPPPAPAEPMSIVGIGCHFGALDCLAAFERAVHDGVPAFRDRPSDRWHGLDLSRRTSAGDALAATGAYVDTFDVDVMGFRIPPGELRHFNAQHLLMLRVAEEALLDSGLLDDTGSPTGGPRRIAVLIATEMEPRTHAYRAGLGIADRVRNSAGNATAALTDVQLAQLGVAARSGIHDPIVPNEVLSYIGNIMSSRISARWNLTGPSFTISGDTSSAVDALRTARLLLRDDTVEAVLVGAVDLAGGAENILARSMTSEPDAGPPTLGFGGGRAGWHIGEGAAAVVVTRSRDAHQGQREYARLVGMATRFAAPQGDELLYRLDESTVTRAAVDCLAEAGADPCDVGYLEVHAGGLPTQDAAEVAGLASVYRQPGEQPPSCALGSVGAVIGDTQVAAGLAAVVKAALSLHHRYLPAVPNWSVPKPEFREAMESAGWHVPVRSMPWLLPRSAGSRFAAVNVIGSAGTCSHLLLSEGEAARSQPAAPDRFRRDIAWERAGGPLLMPITAASPALLSAELDRLADMLAEADLAELLAEQLHRASAPAPFRVVLVAADSAGLRRELDRARDGVPDALAEGREWATPAGSYFTPQPVGPDGKIAFVFPGAFSSYVGLGQDLFRTFPGLLDRFEAAVERPADALRASRLHPRTIAAPSRRELMTREAALLDDVPSMLATGTSFALLHTELLGEFFGVRPHGAFGYSLGESSMLFALGGWEQSARDTARIDTTPLFVDRLCGAKRTVREQWGLADDVPDDAIWATLVLLAPEPMVRAALSRYDRVFITHVNTPAEVVIAGDPAQCRALVDEVGAPSAKAPANHVMHCPVVDAELAELAELNRYPVGTPGDVELLSAYAYDRITEFDSDALARQIAVTLRSTIDFPRLVRTAYERGYRCFIEVGPGSTCTRWVSENLAGAPHLAVATDRRGVSAAMSVGHLLARLVAHGVPVDLSGLAPRRDTSTGHRLIRSIRAGGDSIPARTRAAAESALSTTGSAADLAATARRAGIEETSEMPNRAYDTLADSTGSQLATTSSAGTDAVLTFDGEPFIFVPAPAASTSVEPAPRPTPVSRTEASPPAIARSALTHVATGVDGRAFVRHLRDQVFATHHLVMQAQHALQERSLDALSHIARGDGRAPQPHPPLPAAPITAATTLAPTAQVGPPATSPPAPVPHPDPAVSPSMPTSTGDTVVWNEADLLEFAGGKIANVFGPRFAEIDEFPRRVRLPEPPYLFVTRVTAVDGATGRFEPSSITTEYDVPADAWYAVDGLVPPAVTIEAGQCDLLLISWLGIDFTNRGERSYRLLDSTLVFHGDLPHTGQTLRYDIEIYRFVRNGDLLMFFFRYKCYADGQLILELTDACAGFFTDAELDASLGVVLSDAERRRRAQVEPSWFKPLARTTVDRLGPTELDLLTEGRTAQVFGAAFDQDGANPSLRLPDVRLRMIDEITRIDRRGGRRKLGLLHAVKRLDPDGWYFRCHFTDDPVLAGSMVAEGGVQILQCYALYLGMQLSLPDTRFQTVPGLETRVRVRGQITPRCREIRYEVDITELTLLPRPTVLADITVYDGDKPIILMENFGIQLREKDGAEYRPGAGGVAAFLGRKNADGERAVINELHLAHAAKGDLATAMGPEFEIYRDRRAPHIPNGDFQFVDRIMVLEGTRGVFHRGDSMVTEYDSPPEAWYYAENPAASMPNCVLMETSLQAAILLGYYLGATLEQPGEQFAIRNLDGKATLVRDVDLRGKTIRQHTTLLMHNALPGTVLQSFHYELSADGEVFYRGESLFGYFNDAALANQVGLDSGKHVLPWLDQQQAQSTPPADVRHVDLTADETWDRSDESGLRLADGHYRLLDTAQVLAQGGAFGAGYVSGQRRIDPDDWYFSCHFHRDPVMPGSLGVESVLQAMQLWVIECGLAEATPNPRFALARDVEMSWRYRGQILRDDKEMSLEAHIKQVVREPGRIVVTADASVWKPSLRIYELTNIAIEVRAGNPDG